MALPGFVFISPRYSASESSGDRRVGRQRAVDMHQSHRLPPVILASPQSHELSALGVFVRLDRVTAGYNRVGGLLNMSTQDQVQLGLSPEQVPVGVGALVSDGYDQVRGVGAQHLNGPVRRAVGIGTPDAVGIRTLKSDPEQTHLV